MDAESTEAFELFYSYAHKDERLRKELDKHLFNLKRQGLINEWYDRDIDAGTEWKHEIDSHLNTAHIILLLISPDFLASDYCYSVEMQRALERHETGEARVIPIILKSVDWHGAPFSKLQFLPKNAKAVTSWKDRNEAFTQIAKGIRETLKTLPSPATTSAEFPLQEEATSAPTNDVLSSVLSLDLEQRREPELGPVWYMPYQRNALFTGREPVFQAIRQIFAEQDSAATFQPLILSGTGGIGKTQVAAEYAYRYRGDYQVILWAKADSQEILTTELVGFAALLKLPGQREQDQQYAVDAVKRWLETHGQWLLILDNVDDLKMARSYLPSAPQGHLLLTARSQITGGTARRVDIEPMTPEEGIALLLRRADLLAMNTVLEAAPVEAVREAREIVQILDGFPLAIDQAGAYIEETGASLHRYLDLYTQQRHALLSIRGGWASDHPEPITTTVSLTIDKVKQTSPAARELLDFLAFLHPDAIPDDLLERGSSQLKQTLRTVITHLAEFDQVIGVLRKYSLVRRNLYGATLTMHRLVQDILKDEMDEPTRRAWAECAIRVVNQAFPVPEATTWQLCQRQLSQAQSCALLIDTWQCDFPETAQLLQKVGAYLHQRGQYTEAVPFITQALAIRERTLGAESLAVAESLNEMAELMRHQGSYTESEPLYQRALSIRERELGPDAPEVATSLNNLARPYHHLGRYAEAEPLLKRALTICEQSLGPVHPTTIKVVLAYAVLLEMMNQKSKAAKMRARARVAKT